MRVYLKFLNLVIPTISIFAVSVLLLYIAVQVTLAAGLACPASYLKITHRISKIIKRFLRHTEMKLHLNIELA